MKTLYTQTVHNLSGALTISILFLSVFICTNKGLWWENEKTTCKGEKPVLYNLEEVNDDKIF